jgi:hypothetical protein
VTRVPAGAASHGLDVVKAAELRLGDIHLIQANSAGVGRDAVEQRVANRAWLLKDFLLHEVLVAVFSVMAGVHVTCCTGR